MKTIIAIALFMLMFVSLTQGQTLPIVIDPNNLPSNVVVSGDTICTFELEDGGIIAVHCMKFRVYPKDFNQRVEISYSRMYSYVWDDTITIQHKIWRCDADYPFSSNERGFFPQDVTEENSVLWNQNKEFFRLPDEEILVIDNNIYKMYPVYPGTK